jgi:predicted nuclease with TOPRIM domain
MQDKIQARIDALQKEMETGQQKMQELEGQLARLRETMLRISGAIQVLTELQSELPAATPRNGAGDDLRPGGR